MSVYVCVVCLCVCVFLFVTWLTCGGAWVCSSVRRFEAASTDVDELDKKKMGQDNAIDSLMEEVKFLYCVLCFLF